MANRVHAFKAFPVYTDKAARHTHYAPSGYMGDSDLTLSGAYTKTLRGEGTCLRVNYKANGPKGWVGIYWQDPANNWGDIPGRAGYDLRGATRLTFWARGESGGERVHEFRVGGIVGQYPDSDVATLDNVRLTKEWKQYTIDLRKKDLRHIIGGFGFSLIKAENSGGMVFYLDDILYEGPQDQEPNRLRARRRPSSDSFRRKQPCRRLRPSRLRRRLLPAAFRRFRCKTCGRGSQSQLQLAAHVHAGQSRA